MNQNRRCYRSSIPATATQIIEKRYENGNAEAAYFYLDGEQVGFRQWDETGELEFEYGIQNGKKHGREYRFHPGYYLLEVTPYRNGLMHGVGKQWAADGTVLITYKMTNGSGLDLWCSHENQTLSEEFYWPKEGESGYSRRWNDDEKSINEEYFFAAGKGYHGIWRRWNDRGHFRRGYPQYYVADQRVTKRKYLSACLTDATLPPYCREDDGPVRTLPQEYLRQRR